MNFNSSDIPVVQARISAPGVDLASNYDLLEKHVKMPIQRIPGVAKIDLSGVAPKAIYIDLILDKIREHNIDIGQLVSNGSGRELFHISDLRKLRVYAQIPQSSASSTQVGLAADLVFAERAGEKFPAKIVRTADALDPTSRT